MDASTAQSDLAFTRRVAQSTVQRIDAHAFHCIHWGLIVLIWYPVGTWLWRRGQIDAYITSGVGAFLLGMTLSIVREQVVKRRPRVTASNTVIPKQITLIVFANVAAGAVVSAIGPSGDQFIRGENVPIIWGLVYANIAFSIGLTYSRDFMISGIAIFVGAVLAMVFQAYHGYILGPFMGLGMLIPGLRSEARVRRLAAAPAGIEDGSDIR